MKTIYEYTLHTGPEEQVFHIPGWWGTSTVIGHKRFANQLSVFCHVDTAKPNWIARFMVTATGAESPAPTGDYVFCGSAITAGGYVWHVWRNAMTEKVDAKCQ